jgi:hypothetical protein
MSRHAGRVGPEGFMPHPSDRPAAAIRAI